MTGKFQIIHGDCIEEMKKLPPNSVDALVTDPPYELSNDGKASAAWVFSKMVLPKKTNGDIGGSGECHLSFLVNEILDLSRSRIAPTPSAAMPVRAVTFDGAAKRRKKDIKDVDEATERVADSNTSFNGKSEATKNLGCFELELADAKPLLQCLNDAGTSFSARGIGIGFGVLASELPRLFHGCGSIVIRDENIGFIDDPFALGISANLGAKEKAVAHLSLAGCTDDNRNTTCGALVLLAVFGWAGAKLVRAFPATGRLATELQSRRIRVIHPVTNRTLTFDLRCHDQTVSGKGFMGKQWDGSKIAFNVEMWQEALRVLKPGSHMAVFSGTRTYHRMVSAIEDAGFEIRDQLAWCYGSGFPKSLDVSKALDRAAGVERPVLGRAKGAATSRTDSLGVFPSEYDQTAPATDASRAWSGWGTALKPAWEPICLARKPLIGTVAANVLTHGTGGLNIDACRVPAEKMVGYGGASNQGSYGENFGGKSGFTNPNPNPNPNPNRWPANLLHDGSDEVVAMFPSEAGAAAPTMGDEPSQHGENGILGERKWIAGAFYGDTGSAARFFYTAKASTADREMGMEDFDRLNGGALTGRKEESDGLNSPRAGAGRGGDRANTHPTVKPTDLMVWLVKLITPLGGTVVDPFMGSGSTGRAAAICNMNFIGIDMTAEYIPIAKARINEARGELFAQ